MDKYDFSGWATRNDVMCSDGRIIRRDAFKHNDGMTVPLVWNHDHSDPYRVIGHALLENREDGVYAYGKFNDTKLGQHAKMYVEHGDITQLSIYANQLQQQGPNVMHGSIREVSLVLAGANPEAYIENVMKHGDDESGDEARIFTGLDIELYHSDEDTEKDVKRDKEEVAEENTKNTSNSEKTIAEVFETLNEEQKTVVYALLGYASENKEEPEEDQKEEEVKHADSDDEKTIADVFETLNEEQKTAVYAIIGAVAGEDEEDEESEGGNEDMKHNVFENDKINEENVLSHSEMEAIFKDAPRHGSLKQSVLAHGITDIGEMFPDHKTLNNEPDFIKREDTWVTEVLNGVHHTPFARIKSIHADITAEEARAKGYTKGNLKVEEVFKMLKRTTNPTTIYKKQKIDRDDMLDIRDFDFIGWLKKEIKIMFDEERARAFLLGDGRDITTNTNDKIDEECIRPIWTDDDLYTVKHAVTVKSTATAEEKAKALIRNCIKSRKSYKGSGNPIMFMSEDQITDCLLIEDTNGRVIYDSLEKLAAAMRVRKIVSVPVMDGLKRTDKESVVHHLAGIYVNLNDYNVGTDKGGNMTLFDDFDLDYNKMIYLMEGRCSGALTKPYSAVALEYVEEA